MPVLLVAVGARDFNNGRVGYDLASPPNDEPILKRVDRWWQLKRFLPTWISTPDDSVQAFWSEYTDDRARNS